MQSSLFTKRIHWSTTHFKNLNNKELYQILHLRSKVFIVEQKCIFLDLDNNDKYAHHVMCWKNNELIATSRLFNVNIMYKRYQSIGRVICSPEQRNTGIGKELINYSIQECNRLFGKKSIKIGAQLYLKKFYENAGFIQFGDIYIEDGIEHIHMIRK